MVTPDPPRTFSVWVAGIISRWKLVTVVSLATLSVLAVATVLLPPIYQAHTSFITPVAGGAENLQADESDVPVQSNLSSPDAAIQAPRHYLELLESEELRRRLLLAYFSDPRSTRPGDSARLFEIMRAEGADSAWAFEKASRKLSKSMTMKLDLSTNLVAIDVRTRWPELSAAAANRAVLIADQFAQEQRSARARSRRIFLEARLDETRSHLAIAEDRLRSFELTNRACRTSPDLIASVSRLRREAQLATRRYRETQMQLDGARIDERNDRARITIVDADVVTRKAHWPRYGLLLMSGLTASLLLGLIAGGIAAFIAGQRSPRNAKAPLAKSARSSFISRIGFPLFAWGLVFHSLVITILFGRFGLSAETVRSIAAWKEIALEIGRAHV